MPKDHWSAKAYNAAASMVPQLTSKVVGYLDVQANDRILDLGCGDGMLTAKLAQAAPTGEVFGLDSSQSFIATAQATYTAPNCTFALRDCTALDALPVAVNGSWDKVFSNAAMHWILRAPELRQPFFTNVHAALKPGGMFVFEQGGAGNVAEVQSAATAALVHAGLSPAQARAACPWFFPSPAQMTLLLEAAGFDVEVCELEYRPTRLTPETADGGGGLRGWVRLMCAQYLDCVPEARRGEVESEIRDVVGCVITREGKDQGVENGGVESWLGYTRLRAVARKKGN